MSERIKKLRPKLSPELMKLAEGEIAIQFLEQPQLEAEVKDKVGNLIENRGGRQVIDSQGAIRYLRKAVGVDLGALLCSVEIKDFNAFGRSSRPRVPTPLQARNVAAAYVIVDILLSALPSNVVQDWLTSYSDYLYGIPAIELYRRPEDVRMAALNRISAGDDQVITYRGL